MLKFIFPLVYPNLLTVHKDSGSTIFKQKNEIKIVDKKTSNKVLFSFASIEIIELVVNFTPFMLL